VSIVGILSCTKDDIEIIESDYFLFIEQHTEISGELVSGPQPPLLQIDFPTYHFNSETEILNGVISFDINNDLKLIYGSGTCLSGTAGAGCGTGLSGIYQIPYKQQNFEVLKLEDNGNVIFIYKDEVFNLAPGDEWNSEISRLDSININGELSISKITETDRISNYGLLKKADIDIWKWE
jgi:hypothetical protein